MWPFKRKSAPPIEQVAIGNGVAELTLIPSIRLAILYLRSADPARTEAVVAELEDHLHGQGFFLQVFAL